MHSAKGRWSRSFEASGRRLSRTFHYLEEHRLRKAAMADPMDDIEMAGVNAGVYPDGLLL